jgi:hypothetical protein
MRFILAIITFLVLPNLVGCYPVSAFQGPKGYCIWNITNDEVFVENLNTHKTYTIAHGGYMVLEKLRSRSNMISIKSSEIPLKRIDLSTKEGGSLIKENGVVWKYLLILEGGEVQAIGPSTRAFANAVIHQASPQKNW